jgi:hypothetical protein
MLDWIRSLDPSFEPTLQELQADRHTYLVPDYEDAQDINEATDD